MCVEMEYAKISEEFDEEKAKSAQQNFEQLFFIKIQVMKFGENPLIDGCEFLSREL